MTGQPPKTAPGHPAPTDPPMSETMSDDTLRRAIQRQLEGQHDSPRRAPDPRRKAEAMARDLRQIAVLDRSGFRGLQSGDVLRRWHGGSRLCRWLRRCLIRGRA